MSNFIQEQNLEREDYKKSERYQYKLTFRSIICNKRVKGGIFVTIFAFVVPILLYYYIIHRAPGEHDDYRTCLIKSSFRVPCGNSSISAKDCERVQCCYDNDQEQCYHFMPSKYTYDYNDNAGRYEASLGTTPYGNKTIQSLSINIEEINPNKLSVTLVETTSNKKIKKTRESSNYTTILSSTKLMLEVNRNTGEKIFSTAYGALIASENYWEWSFFLSENYTFGFGQTLIAHNTTIYQTKVFYNNKHIRGVAPVFWGYVNEKFQGVVIKHDGPLEVMILPSNLVVLKSLTGKKIEIEIYLGPTPKDLHDQMMGEVEVPPKWVLGSHVCRKSDNTNLNEIIVDEYKENDYISDCIHENLLMALQKNSSDLDLLKNKIETLKNDGKKIWLAVPPHIYANETNILHTQAEDLKLLYQNNTSPYVGEYVNLNVSFPDFLNPNINEFIKNLDDFIESTIELNNIDGFLLVSNWPKDDSYTLEDNSVFPYFSEDLKNALSSTIPWYLNMTSTTAKHIEYHNMYASNQISVVSQYFKSKKPELIVESSSAIFGENQDLVLENVDASWDNMKETLDTVLFDSITGNHLVSVPICGDTSNYDPKIHETLCIRWYLLALTMPTFRMYSEKPFRESDSLNTIFAQNTAKKSITTRSLLEAYYYTILSRKEPVVRPLFYDFYRDVATLSVQNQYMIGENLLVAHPLTSGQSKLSVYLPESVKVWYEFYGGKSYNSTKNSTWFDFNIIETDNLMFVAQGSVIPLMNETYLSLVVALDCDPKDCEAKGSVKFEENSLNFVATETEVTISNLPLNCSIILSQIKVFSYNNYIQLLSKNVDICSFESDTISVPYDEPITTTTTQYK